MLQIMNSAKFVNYKDRKPFCADIGEIYTAANEEAGSAGLDRFEVKWGNKYFYAIRRLIYTINKYEKQWL